MEMAPLTQFDRDVAEFTSLLTVLVHRSLGADRHAMSAETPSLIELVRRAKRSDAAAREALADSCYPRVRQIVALRIRRTAASVSEHDDVVQEALLNVLESLHQFASEDSERAFLAWVTRCVENSVRDYFRSLGAEKRGGNRVRRWSDYPTSVLSTSILHSPADTPSSEATAAELGDRIEAALLEMPDHYREVFVQYQLIGLSYDEIAAQLKISPTNARKLASRALTRLREAIPELPDRTTPPRRGD